MDLQRDERIASDHVHRGLATPLHVPALFIHSK